MVKEQGIMNKYSVSCRLTRERINIFNNYNTVQNKVWILNFVTVVLEPIPIGFYSGQ